MLIISESTGYTMTRTHISRHVIGNVIAGGSNVSWKFGVTCTFTSDQTDIIT